MDGIHSRVPLQVCEPRSDLKHLLAVWYRDWVVDLRCQGQLLLNSSVDT